MRPIACPRRVADASLLTMKPFTQFIALSAITWSSLTRFGASRARTRNVLMAASKLRLLFSMLWLTAQPSLLHFACARRNEPFPLACSATLRERWA